MKAYEDFWTCCVPYLLFSSKSPACLLEIAAGTDRWLRKTQKAQIKASRGQVSLKECA